MSETVGEAPAPARCSVCAFVVVGHAIRCPVCRRPGTMRPAPGAVPDRPVAPRLLIPSTTRGILRPVGPPKAGPPSLDKLPRTAKGGGEVSLSPVPGTVPGVPGTPRANASPLLGPEVTIVRASEARAASIERTPTGVWCLDHLLNGGLYDGQTILLIGGPGTGKSALVGDLGLGMAERGAPVAVLAFEEPADEVRTRYESLGLVAAFPRGMEALHFVEVETNDPRHALRALDRLPEPPALVVADSLSFARDASLPGEPGERSQLGRCASILYRRAHATGEWAGRRKCAMVVIVHGTKDGDLSGPLAIVHKVDGGVIARKIDEYGIELEDQTEHARFILWKVYQKVRFCGPREPCAGRFDGNGRLVEWEAE